VTEIIERDTSSTKPASNVSEVNRLCINARSSLVLAFQLNNTYIGSSTTQVVSRGLYGLINFHPAKSDMERRATRTVVSI